MRKLKHYNAVLIVLCALFMLSACGQKGDLYLPQGQANQTMVG